MIQKLILTLLASATITAGAHAQQLLTQFTFETSQPAGALAANTAFTSFNSESGTTGTATGLHATTSTYSSPAGNGSSHSFSSNGWSTNDYYQFTINTTGVSGIFVEFSAVSSATGPTSFALVYSVDGGTNFTLTSTNPYAVTSAPSFSAGTFQAADVKQFDLSGVTALNGVANVIFRLVDVGASTASGGTSRVDDFTVSTGGFIPLPEPSTYGMALGGLGVLGLIYRQRRRTA